MYLVNHKRFVIVSVLAMLVISVSGCRKKANGPTPTVSDAGNNQHAGWVTDFEKAKQTAKTEGKDLLIDFSGSDWCGWCIKLDNEVFSKKDFLNEAKKEFVLVLIDFPNNKSRQSKQLQQQNEVLGKTYQIEFFPTVVLANADGKGYAQTGYQKGGPKAYLEHLQELRKEK